MMIIKFEGGPWDSVEFNADFVPDFVTLKIRVEEQTKSQQLGIPQEDPDNPDFGTRDAAILDTEPVELQSRTLFYKRDENMDESKAIFKVSDNDLHWLEDIPEDPDM